MVGIIRMHMRLPFTRRIHDSLTIRKVRSVVQAPRSISTSRSLRESPRFQEGDRVLLETRYGTKLIRRLSARLQKDHFTIINNDQIPHASIIDQRPPLRIDPSAKDGIARFPVFVTQPDLETFTAESPRRVMPIYASYGATIVSLLDIHVGPPIQSELTTVTPDFEILEAGTGHGALTLQLGRAVAAGNYPFPHRQDFNSPGAYALAVESWKKKRSAIVHTVDIDPLNCKHAEKVISSFRGGIYVPHIDFHAGTAIDWMHEQMASRNKHQFLDVVVLDMPDVHKNLAAAANALRDGGQLLVFVPQITQIAACIQEIQNKRLPLRQRQVVELGEGVSTGRLWDVRMATVRKAEREAMKKAQVDKLARTESTTEEDTPPLDEAELAASDLPEITIPPMVCRPKVWEVTRGGGFIGLWSRSMIGPGPACNYPGLPNVSGSGILFSE